MELYKRKALILAKIETTYGTDASPAGANAINVSNLKIEPAKGTKKLRNLLTSDMSTSSGIITQKYQAVSFTMELKGSGTAGTAPECGPVLRACMMAEAINGVIDVSYTPVSASFESCTVWVNQDGVLHKLVGCRGTWSIEVNAGDFPTIAVDLLGLYAGPTDAAALTPTYSAVVPVEVNDTNTDFTLDAFAAVLHKLSAQLGAKSQYREFVNSAASITLSGREAKGSISIDAVKMATKNYFSTWANGSLVAMALTHGTVAGNIVAISAPKVQLDDLQYGEADGILTYEMPVSFTRSTGNDEITLTFK